MGNQFNSVKSKNNSVILFVCLILMMFLGCDIDRPVKDKSKLLAMDYRLFQGTEAWLLAKAAYYKDTDSIKKILAKNPNVVNIQDSIYGNTVLMLTIMRQEFDSFNALIDNGANINYYNKFGESPLIEACSYRQYDLKFAQRLVEEGACVNDTSQSLPYEQQSPLMVAARCGNMPIVKYLLTEGANINYRSNIGSTVLGMAMRIKRFEIALLLLENGADFSSPIYNTVDKRGKLTIPETILGSLRRAMPEPFTSDVKYKRKIIDFLKQRGLDYDTVPIPNYIIKREKERYPSTWEEYIRNY